MRRHLLAYVSVSTVIASAVGFGVSRLAGGWTVPTLSARSEASVVAPLDNLGVLGSRLVVSGTPPTAGPQSCEWAKVETASLNLGTTNRCDSWSPGTSASVEDVPTGSLMDVGTCKPNSGAIRPVLVGLKGEMSQPGPVLMRFVDGCSGGTQPVTALNGTNLWVYDSATGASGRSGVASEISTTTGAVEADVAMPSMCRPTIAADDSGLFLSSWEPGGPGDDPIYFLPNGSRHPEVVGRADVVDWMLATDDSVIVSADYDWATPCADDGCKLLRFDGQHATPSIITDDFPEQSAPVGDLASGLFDVAPASPNLPVRTSWDINSIDPRSGHVTTIGHLPASTFVNAGPPELAFFDHELFALQPETPGQPDLLFRWRVS